MLINVWDTETTGLPLFNDPSEDPRQPHIVELAAILIDDKTREEKGLVHYIVRPDGWTIPDEVAAIHGITQERAMDEGIPEWKVIREFHELNNQADLRVAHNGQFDDRIMRIAIKRFGKGYSDVTEPEYTQDFKDELADAFKSRPSYCTMKNSTNILNLPATPAMIKSGRGSWKKQPSLAEAYKHFFGEEMEGAHSALFDARNCAKIYFALTQK
jgi:DNA polymerase-3 subunit epsilon